MAFSEAALQGSTMMSAKQGRELWETRLKTAPGDFLAEIIGLLEQTYGGFEENDLRTLLKVRGLHFSESQLWESRVGRFSRLSNSLRTSTVQVLILEASRLQPTLFSC